MFWLQSHVLAAKSVFLDLVLADCKKMYEQLASYS
jgi:hypothetical protein